MMKNVTITKGVHAGKTGDAEPFGAIGPIGNRTFIVRVTLHDGSGQVELPLDAIK
jgi:hypothetical protein